MAESALCTDDAPDRPSRTPTQRSQAAHHDDDNNNNNDDDDDIQSQADGAVHNFHFTHHDHHAYDTDRPLPTTVYLVTDTLYPSAANFDISLGATSIISAHGSKRAANERAKKVIYENDGGCTVDIDKIIEEVKDGLYTGIGVGGQEGNPGGCFARKCEVEAKVIDDDSEDESSGDSLGYDGASIYGNEHNTRRDTPHRRHDPASDEGDVDMG